MTIAGIDAPKPGKTVDQLMTGCIGDRRPRAGLDHAHADLLVGAIGGNRMHQMGAVEFDQRVAQHVYLQVQPRAWLASAKVWKGDVCCA
jgi:hypothetical protein